MSELQIGLLAIGVLVVIGVLGYNKWQESRYRRDADLSLKSMHNDVLLEEIPSAQGLESDEAPAASAADSAGRIEPAMSKQSEPAGTVPELPALSEKLDFIVSLEASEEIEGGALIEAAAGLLASFDKRVLMEGYNQREARWEPLVKGERYSMLRAGLQLTDRRGPVSTDELTNFGAAVQAAAAAGGAVATVPDRSEAIRQAAELNVFCSDADILVAISVVGAQGAALVGTRIRGLAEAAGFLLDDDGRFRRRDEQGRVLFELASLDGKPFKADAMRTSGFPGITLELDVPRAPGGIRAFQQFRDQIRHFAQGLDGQMIDDNRRPLSPAAFDQIRGQIEAVHSAIEARGIAAGSANALRLFS